MDICQKMISLELSRKPLKWLCGCCSEVINIKEQSSYFLKLKRHLENTMCSMSQCNLNIEYLKKINYELKLDHSNYTKRKKESWI